MERDDRTQVFVICPIGRPGTVERARADDLYTYVVKRALTELNAGRPTEERFKATRADKSDEPSEITPQIIRDIAASPFVIVDATGQNANVFYELGVADAFGIPTIRIVDEPTSLPFDTKDHRNIVLPSAEDGHLRVADAYEARRAVERQARRILEEGFQVKSVVTTAKVESRLSSIATELGESDDKLGQLLTGLTSEVRELKQEMLDLGASVKTPPDPERRSTTAMGTGRPPFRAELKPENLLILDAVANALKKLEREMDLDQRVARRARGLLNVIVRRIDEDPISLHNDPASLAAEFDFRGLPLERVLATTDVESLPEAAEALAAELLVAARR